MRRENGCNTVYTAEELFARKQFDGFKDCGCAAEIRYKLSVALGKVMGEAWLYQQEHFYSEDPIILWKDLYLLKVYVKVKLKFSVGRKMQSRRFFLIEDRSIIK